MESRKGKKASLDKLTPSSFSSHSRRSFRVSGFGTGLAKALFHVRFSSGVGDQSRY